MSQKRISKQDKIAHLYVSAVSAVKTKGVLNSQQEIYRLVDAVVVKKTSIEPLHTSEDIQSQVYLKLVDWLSKGKRSKKMSVEQILNPSHIKKTARSFGFSGAKYPMPVCKLEDWTPVEHLQVPETENQTSRLLEIWLKYQDKLDARSADLIHR